MTDLSPFKLLFLPSLSYEAIVQKMKVREQYKLATVSKRMQRVVSESNRISIVSCLLSLDHDQLVFTITHKATRSKYLYKLRPNERDDYFLLAKDQVVFLKNSLRLQTVDLCFSEHHPVRIEQDFVSFLRQKILRIRDISYYSYEKLKDESYEYLLNEGKDCRQLELYMNCSPKFRPSPCPVLSVEEFVSTACSWVTVDQLVTNFINCKEINLGRCQFTPQQLNPFIKKWIEGSRIEFCDFRVNSVFQFESIVDGINATEIRQAYTPRYGHEPFHRNECFLIEQSSGVKALLYERGLSVCLTTNFSLESPLVGRLDDTGDYSFDEDEESGEEEESDEEEPEGSEEGDDPKQDNREDNN